MAGSGGQWWRTRDPEEDAQNDVEAELEAAAISEENTDEGQEERQDQEADVAQVHVEREGEKENYSHTPLPND